MKIFTMLFATVILLNNQNCFAQAGTLDSSFGGTGKIITRVGFGNEASLAVAIQTDAKIVQAGYTNNGVSTAFALVRYNLNGKLDQTFGHFGKTIDEIGGRYDVGYSLAIQTDGRIVLGGYAYVTGQLNNFALARYLKNGKPDSSFGVNGKTITDLGGDDHGHSIAIQSDGKILIIGTKYRSEGSDHAHLALLRYKRNGSLDSSFGQNGKIINNFGMSASGYSLAVQADGKIIATGTLFNGLGNFLILRYKPDGTPDTSFGKNGVVKTNLIGSVEHANAIVIQPDGKFVVGGYYYKKHMAGLVLALVRYTTGGSLDSSFANNGQIDDYFGVVCTSLALQTDGKIVVGGRTGFSNSNFVVVRYNNNGKLDSSFGSSGKVTTDFGHDDAGYSVALQADGKIVLAGNSDFSFAIARYHGDSTSVTKTSGSYSSLKKQTTPSSGIYLLPNPVKDMLHVEGLSSSPKTISVIDVNRKLLQQITTANSNYSISTKQLAAGIYFIRIDEGDKSTTLKFIKE